MSSKHNTTTTHSERNDEARGSLRAAALFSGRMARLLAIAALLGAGAPACVAPADSAEDLAAEDPASDEAIGEAQENLYGYGWSWPKGTDGVTEIPVCWKSSGADDDKKWVRSAVEGHWGAVSSIRFSGWGLCDGSTPDAAIRISYADVGPYTSTYGTASYGAEMVLNFTYDNWTSYIGSDCDFFTGCDYYYCSDDRKYCDGLIALHEFGHALGFDHEQVRPENANEEYCDEWQSGETTDYGGVELTSDYDTTSIMNYCGEWDRATPHISAGDITGVIAAYGSKPNHLTNQVLIYSDTGYRGDVQALYAGGYYSMSGAVGNDSLTSLRVPAGWSVTMYDNTNLGGSSVNVTSDVTDLSTLGFNDKTSSLFVWGPGQSFPVIYKDTNYGGSSQTLRPGVYTSSGSLTIGNDAASSLSVPTGWKVTLYENANFGGSSATYTSSSSSLGGMNDKTTSIKVEGPAGWTPVMIFKDSGYTGSGQALWPGRYEASNLSIGNDDLTSLTIPDGWTVTLTQNSPFWGDMVTYTSSQSSVSGSSFNDTTSSIIVEGPERSWSTFKAKHSSKCLDVYAFGQSDGSDVLQWDCNTATNQKFDLVPTSDGYYNIVAKHSSRCLDVTGASSADGAEVYQWTCHGADNQKFSIQSTGDGYFKLVAKHSGKCVTIAGASTATGAAIQQSTCTGADNQKFTVGTAAL